MSRRVIPGVYEIVDQHKRCYIGSSVDVYKRWSQHRRSLEDGKHHSWRLQRAWNRYGADAFTFRLLQVVENESDLLAAEQYFLDTFRPCFNICDVAGRPQWGEEAKARARTRALDRQLMAEIREHADIEAAYELCCVVYSELDAARTHRPEHVEQGVVDAWRGMCVRASRGLDPWDVTDETVYVDKWRELAAVPGIPKIRRWARYWIADAGKDPDAPFSEAYAFLEAFRRRDDSATPLAITRTVFDEDTIAEFVPWETRLYCKEKLVRFLNAVASGHPSHAAAKAYGAKPSLWSSRAKRGIKPYQHFNALLSRANECAREAA